MKVIWHSLDDSTEGRRTRCTGIHDSTACILCRKVHILVRRNLNRISLEVFVLAKKRLSLVDEYIDYTIFSTVRSQTSSGVHGELRTILSR